jgi:hypothetical protein
VAGRDEVYAEVYRVLAAGVQESMSEMTELMRDFDAVIEYQVGYAQAGFTLENGEEQLARYFPVVELHRHDGALEVTEAEPLLRYILSGGERWKTIRDEKRHRAGQMGTRAHDPEHVHCTADAQGRLIMGKLVFDTMRGVDFLESLPWVDSDRMGVAGLSLGGAKAGWMCWRWTRVKNGLSRRVGLR